MPTYIVYRKSDGETLTSYSAASTTDMEGKYPLADYDHIVVPPGEPAPSLSIRVLSKLEYLRRFTQAERIVIKQAAVGSPELSDYLYMLELAQDIDLDDPDTIAAINMLEAIGLIGLGRAAEILS